MAAEENATRRRLILGDASPRSEEAVRLTVKLAPTLSSNPSSLQFRVIAPAEAFAYAKRILTQWLISHKPPRYRSGLRCLPRIVIYGGKGRRWSY